MSIFNENNTREVTSSELKEILDQILETSVPQGKEQKKYIATTDSYRHLFFANTEEIEFIEFGDMGGYNVEPLNVVCGLLHVQVRSIFSRVFSEIKIPVKTLSNTNVDDVIYCKLDVRHLERDGCGRTVTFTNARYIPLAKKVSADKYLVLNDIPNLY